MLVMKLLQKGQKSGVEIKCYLLDKWIKIDKHKRRLYTTTTTALSLFLDALASLDLMIETDSLADWKLTVLHHLSSHH